MEFFVLIFGLLVLNKYKYPQKFVKNPHLMLPLNGKLLIVLFPSQKAKIILAYFEGFPPQSPGAKFENGVYKCARYWFILRLNVAYIRSG